MIMIESALISVFGIFVLIGLGMLAMKKRWINSEIALSFPKLIINFSLPGQIITTFNQYFCGQMGSVSPAVIFAPLIAMLIAFLLSMGLARILKIPPHRRGVFCVLSALSNSVFIGFPIAQAIFGGEGMGYAAFFFLSNTIVFWTFGYLSIRADGDKLSGLQSKITLSDIFKKLFNTPVITIVISLVLAYANVSLPAIIIKPAEILSGLTTPLSMMFLGSVIYTMGRDVFKLEKGIIAAVIMRFVVSFIIMYGVSKVFGLSGMPLDVYCIMAVLPAMTQTGITSALYGADKNYATKGMAITTLLSIAVIPLFSMLIDYI